MTTATLTVRVLWAMRKRGGRKLILSPHGVPLALTRGPQMDNALIKAIARAHRWKRMLETGPYTSLRELAAAEKINEAYLARILRLTLLAPDIVDGILDGCMTFELRTLLESIPVAWEEQHAALPSKL